MTPTDTRISRARMFARAAHDSIGQKRKYTGTPYWEHVERVASIVSQAGGCENAVVVAFFHDILEDVTPKNSIYDGAMIEAAFGFDVMMGVVALTDVYTKETFPTWNRARRKAAEAERLGKIATEWKLVKLADMLDNSADILANDPDFAKVYLREKEYLLPFLTVANDPRNVALAEKLRLTIPQTPVV